MGRFATKQLASKAGRGAVAAAVVAVLPLLMAVGPLSSFTITTQQLGKDGATSGNGAVSVTYSVVPGMLRMDAEQPAQGAAEPLRFSMILVFKPDQVVSIVLAPNQKKYAERTQTPKAYLSDPNNIQSIFEAPSSAAGLCHDSSTTSCKMLGSDVVLGRSVEKWLLKTKGPNGTQDTATVWYDPLLHFIIQVRNSDGSGFVPEKISLAEPSAALFRIPKGYTKF